MIPAMIPVSKTLALASAVFAAISSAAPVNLNEREDLGVWETVTTVVWTTVDVTTTVYLTQQAAATTSTIAVVSAGSTLTAAPAPGQAKTTESQATQLAATVVSNPVVAAVDQAATEEPWTAQGPQPANTAAPSTYTTQASQQTSSSSSGTTSGSGSSGSSGICSKNSPCFGQATFYDTATSASAPSSCGLTNDGFTEDVLALPVSIMTDADCGKTVTITYNGVTRSGTVVDKCMGCDNTSVDLSRHFFGQLADMGAGRLYGVSWYIN
ncbi:allergen Asp F7-like, putative [Aspergillus udagawae]|nr:allergen Asp F7-like, putative [Aspergillus udagawae]